MDRTWLLAVALKPLVLLLFFLFVAVLARLIGKLIPEGKLKRLLFRRIN